MSKVSDESSPILKNSAGIVRSLRDGIGEVLGLSDVQSGELVLSEQNYGLVLNLQQFSVGVVFMSDINLRAGSVVHRLYDLINVSASIYSLGSVVNSLGNDYLFQNLKFLKTIAASVDGVSRLVELKAPGIIVRQSVYESLNTGSKIIDAIVPIGLGQRELVIGDRQTGKTAIVIDAVLLKN